MKMPPRGIIEILRTLKTAGPGRIIPMTGRQFKWIFKNHDRLRRIVAKLDLLRHA